MAVIYYGEGTHDAGFVGFRVARTVGVADDYRQEYFSLREYSYATAHRLAYSLDRKWEAEAEEVKRRNKTCRRRNARQNVIVNGLRAYINIENRTRKGVRKTYFTPCFLVKKPGYGNGDISFRTAVHGYRKAFEKAVDKYCELHDLTDEQRNNLLGCMPGKEVFTEYLFNTILLRGHQIRKEELITKLCAAKNQVELGNDVKEGRQGRTLGSNGVESMDRESWLFKFRRAKCQDTLDKMRDAAIRNYEGNIRVIADIVLAHEARDAEIDNGIFCRVVR